MKLAVFLFSVLFSVSSFAKDVVVLVPGFFNSFTPEYFSGDIVKAFQDRGFKVYIANGLNPIGTIEDNGNRLIRYLTAVEKAEGERVEFNLIAHSAGGFYSLFVANTGKFQIKNILTVGTPYKGVQFVEYLLQNSLPFQVLTDLAHLDGLTQLTSTGVKKFLTSIRLAPNTRVLAFGGFQRKSFDVWNARYLSTPLRVTSLYINGDSDGIVSYDSALGLGDLITTDGKKAVQLTNPDYFVDLEHWEQVLDSRSFLLLGIRNTGYIRREQIRFYSGLADGLLKLQ